MTNIYLVICGTREPYVAERDLKEMGREETIKSLAAGEWGDLMTGHRFTVSSIIEVDTGADRTEEFKAVALLLMDSYRTPYSREEAAQWQADRARAIEAAE
jgi:hypothetical protein